MKCVRAYLIIYGKLILISLHDSFFYSLTFQIHIHIHIFISEVTCYFCYFCYFFLLEMPSETASRCSANCVVT